MLYYVPQYFSTTLNVGGGIDDTQTTGIVLQSVSGVDITKPGILCLSYSDPIDTDNAEWITYTSINGSNELQGVTRGQEGYTAKSHSNGAAIAWPLSKSHINNMNDTLLGTVYGWTLSTATFTRTGAFTVTSSVDLSSILIKGTCIKLTDTTTKYFYVESAVYSGGVTTITFITTTTNVLAGNPTAVYYSNVTPVDMPWLAFSPTFTGFSSNPTVVAKYYITGRLMTVKYYTTANGTSNATTFTITLPTTTENVADLFFGNVSYVVDNGSATYGSYICAANSNIVTIYRQTIGAFTPSGPKQFTGFIQTSI